MQDKNRVIGIDIYRILCMFAITVSFHLIGYGNLLKETEGNFFNHFLTLFLYSFRTFGINGFIVISSVFLIDAVSTVKKVIRFDTMVIFYAVVIGMFGLLFSADIYKPNIIKTFFPILTSYYWYSTSYVILLLLVPFLNIFIKAMDKRTFTAFIIMAVVIFEIWCGMNITLNSAEYVGHASKGILWFVLLYFVTAYVKLYMNEVKPKYGKFVFVFGLILYMVLKYLEELGIGSINQILSETEILNNNSILSLIVTISGYIAFKDIQIDNKKAVVKIVNHITPSLFGIYLIQENLLFRSFLWKHLNSLTRNWADSWVLIPMLIVVFMGFWIVSHMLNYIYQFLQKRLFIKVENYICSKIIK